MDTHTLYTLNELTRGQPRPGHGVEQRLDKSKTHSSDAELEAEDRIRPSKAKTARRRILGSVTVSEIMLTMFITAFLVIFLVTLLLSLISK